MSDKNRTMMPSSMGGLVRYFDEYKSKIEISPGMVIAASIALIIIILILQAYGKRWMPG